MDQCSTGPDENSESNKIFFILQHIQFDFHLCFLSGIHCCIFLLVASEKNTRTWYNHLIKIQGDYILRHLKNISDEFATSLQLCTYKYYRIVFQSNIWLRCRSWQVWILPSGKKGWDVIWIAQSISVFFSHWMENSIIHSTKFHGLQYCAFQIVDKDFIWISPRGWTIVIQELTSLTYAKFP